MPNISNTDIDLTFLNEIADGSDEFIIESIDMFLDQVPQLLQEISTAACDNDWPNMAVSAHKLKPNLGFFGMLNCQALMQEVETLCRAATQNPAEIMTKFSLLKEMINANLVTLAQLKAEKEAGL